MLSAAEMDWRRFDTGGEDPREAFEAFAGQLFNHWCRREYGPALRDVRFVGGKGGDGGWEAYALVSVAGAREPEAVGLQAKWFRDPLTETQIKQIAESFRTACQTAQRRGRRLARYCVAIPRKLNDDRAGTRKSERRRWEEWKGRAAAAEPGTVIELWDEPRLEELLNEPENEGLRACWFKHSVFTMADLERRFRLAKEGWLEPRYVPALHEPAQIESDLGLRLGTAQARRGLLQSVHEALRTLRGARDGVARLPLYSEFMALVDARELLDEALGALDRLLDAGASLEEALRTGSRMDDAMPEVPADDQVLHRLHRVLQDLDLKAHLHLAPTHDISRCLEEGLHAPAQLRKAGDDWRRAWLLGAYVGPPGVGKTHGLAHAVQERFKAKLPALILRARDCTVDDGWGGILQKALEWPNERLDQILHALEATAVLADLRRARENGLDQATDGIQAEPTCFLLAIDGLEEGGEHRCWAELLRELAAVHLREHERIRVVVTLRTSSLRDILGEPVRSDRFDVVKLSGSDKQVQGLIRRYCQYHQVEPPDHRLRWAIREPLSLRLYCELKQQEPRWEPGRQGLALPALLARKLTLVEDALREEGGWSRHDDPLRTILTVVAEAYVQGGPLRREEAISRASAEMPDRISQAHWVEILDQAARYGLLLLKTSDPQDPARPRLTTVEPAYDPLTDYLIARAASEGVMKALDAGEAPVLPQPLLQRPDAREQLAIVLAAEHGISLIRSGLWRDELPAEEIERLELCAIVALEGREAEQYRDWVIERLRASMPSCRRVLRELCIPVARDPRHPFAPRFVHDALLPLTPVKRDLFWSGPHASALEVLSLEPDDAADGPPLLLAWGLTSVNNWQRHVRRAALAQWGANRLDELPKWLDLALETNDPQMAEDATMVAFGAACLAGTDPRLGELVRWVNDHLLAPDGRRRREDIIVLHAARGIVERARVMGIEVDAATLERARRLYSTAEATLPIDATAAASADDHHGVTPITGDFAWYVVPRSMEPFFRDPRIGGRTRHGDLDQRAIRILTMHAELCRLPELSPQRFAFGVLMAHLRLMDWNDQHLYGTSSPEPQTGLDASIETRYRPATHGARSLVSTVTEKYIWTGCRMLQAYLAAHLPLHPDSIWNPRDEVLDPPVDPVLVANPEPNPASDAMAFMPSKRPMWTLWGNRSLEAPLQLAEHDMADRAVAWVRNAPWPDPRPWLLLPRDARPAWGQDDEWIMLGCVVLSIEQGSQAGSVLRIGSAAISEQGSAKLRASVGPGLQIHNNEICEFSERIRCKTYTDPVEAVWAPWARGEDEVMHVSVDAQSGDNATAEFVATMAGGTYRRPYPTDEHNHLFGERTIWLPAGWIRRVLELVDATASHGGAEWRFMDRSGTVHAVYSTSRGGFFESQETLVIRRSSLERALTARGLSLVWGGWLHREPSALLLDRYGEERPYVRRNWHWLGFMTTGGPEIMTLLDAEEGAPAPTEQSPTPPPPPPPPPLVPVGPTNPDLAVPLSTDLEHDDAIPYFLWDDPIPVRELRRRLETAPTPERDRLLGKILREARDTDVWRFTTPAEVARRFSALVRHLGRRRAFWDFLLNRWHMEGLLAEKPA